MESKKVRIELLHKEHEKKNFSCGIEALDRYLIQQAGQDAKRHVTATYVLTEINSNIVCGYYSLCSTSIALDTLPEDMLKKLPRYPTLPAILLGRLAVEQKFHGKKFGDLLLIDALKRSLKLSKELAAMAVIVDAKNDAAISFYKHYEFIQFPDSKNQLFLPMATVAQIWKDI